MLEWSGEPTTPPTGSPAISRAFREESETVLDLAHTTVVAVTFIALFAGHHLGDYPLQSPLAARGKAAPTRPQLAAGGTMRRGWGRCAQHVAVYAAAQAACLAVTWAVCHQPVRSAVTALVVSATTHAVIDRRWVVRAVLVAKGQNDSWPEGPERVDQALHMASMFAGTLLGAATTSWLQAGVVVVAAAALIPAAMLVEQFVLGRVPRLVDVGSAGPDRRTAA